MSLPIALQLYSIRDVLYDDFYDVLKQVKEMGYDGVELPGLSGIEPDELRHILLDLDLPAISSHVPIPEIMDSERLQDYKKVGCEYVAIPWMDHSDHSKVLENIELIGKIADTVKKAGLMLLYHNHDFEFRKINGKYILDMIYEGVPEDRLKTQVDTCWAKFAGVDPATYLRKYKGRAPLVHLKDFIKGESDATPFELIGKAEEKKKTDFRFMPIGYGCQDMPSVLKASVEAGAKWVIVEQDKSDDRPTMEAARMSVKYLRSFEW
ncbi:MAG: sugar phosphate isomerase/epimerase family protein [Christensenellales bacterium]|jgi:sugar phosphate isomerase/epimerase